MRKYFLHIGAIILIKVAVVTLMAHYLFPKEERTKVDVNLIQYKLMG